DDFPAHASLPLHAGGGDLEALQARVQKLTDIVRNDDDGHALRARRKPGVWIRVLRRDSLGSVGSSSTSRSRDASVTLVVTSSRGTTFTLFPHRAGGLRRNGCGAVPPLPCIHFPPPRR